MAGCLLGGVAPLFPPRGPLAYVPAVLDPAQRLWEALQRWTVTKEQLLSTAFSRAGISEIDEDEPVGGRCPAALARKLTS